MKIWTFSVRADGCVQMRELGNRSITIANILPPLQSHTGMSCTFSEITATCITRAYQRARKRSYSDRNMKFDGCEYSEEVYMPFDIFSYHVVFHGKYEFDCAQQIRIFQDNDDLHHSVTRYMVEHGMFPENALREVLSYLRDFGIKKFAQVGGWISRPGYRGRLAHTVPIVSWAFNRAFAVPFVYAICRIDNGAADLLERMGAFRISGDYRASHYNNSIRVMGFHISEKAKYENRINQAQIFLRDQARLYVGTKVLDDVDVRSILGTRYIPNGGWNGFPQGGPDVRAS